MELLSKLDLIKLSYFADTAGNGATEQGGSNPRCEEYFAQQEGENQGGNNIVYFFMSPTVCKQKSFV